MICFVRRSLFTITTGVFLACIIGTLGVEVNVKERIAAAATDDLSPDIPYVVPQPQNKQASFDDFSWRSFIALNWPVAMDGEYPKRGVPDRGKGVGDLSVPRVWESWKADYELFQNGGLPPSPWDSYQAEDPALRKPSASRMLTRAVKVLPLIAKGTSVLNGTFNQAMAGPLIDQRGHYVRYEIRLNQSYYDFIRDNALYLRSNLAKYEWPSPKLNMSASIQGQYGVIEIKAAWRDMSSATPKEKKRYYISEALVPEAQNPNKLDRIQVGLVGFHIAHKTSPFAAWVWSTFEQVDNVPDNENTAVAPYSFSDGHPDAGAKQLGYSPPKAWKPIPPGSINPSPQPVEVVRLNDISDSARTVNTKYEGLLAGTVWQYYKLINTQWPLRPDLAIVPHDPTKPGDIYNGDDTTHGQPVTPEGRGGCQVPVPTDNVANITMETYYQGKGVLQSLLKNLGSSCMHCHYQTAQSDFSWVLEDMAYPRPRTFPKSAAK